MRLPEGAVERHFSQGAGERGQLAITQFFDEQFRNSAQMNRRYLGQSGEAGFGQGDHHATSVRVGIGATDQTLPHEPIDAPRHARARAVGLGGQLAHAQLTARLSKLGQDVEIAKGQPDLLDEIGCQLAHESGVRAQQRLPGVEPALVGNHLSEDPLEERRSIVLLELLHAQSV